MSEELKMPPAGCPNDGVCLSIFPRLRSVEDEVKKIVSTQGRVEHIETVMSERDKAATKLWNAMLCLLGLSIVHFCAFLIWVGGTTERLAQFKEVDSRHEAAIFRIEHGGTP